MVLIGCLISPICHASPTTGEEVIIWDLAYPAERLGAESTQCSSALFPSLVYPCEPFVATLVFLDSPTLFLTQVTQAPKKNPWCLFFCACLIAGAVSHFSWSRLLFSQNLYLSEHLGRFNPSKAIFMLSIFMLSIFMLLFLNTINTKCLPCILDLWDWCIAMNFEHRNYMM